LSSSDLHELYNEFETFKDNPQFHQLGFGRGGPFVHWRDRVASLIKKYADEGDEYGLHVAQDLLDYAFATMWSVQPELNRKDRRHWKAKANKLRRKVV
jgi:hypothetical protein